MKRTYIYILLLLTRNTLDFEISLNAINNGYRTTTGNML